METKILGSMITQVWLSKFIGEYVSGSGYKRYMGSSDTSIIRVMEELKKGGEAINIPLSTQVKGRGVRNDEQLSGNEAVMGFANDQVRVGVIRQAVKITENQTYKTVLDLFGAARSRLKDWFAVNLRNSINDALKSVIVKGTVDEFGFGNDTKVLYENANATQLNDHLTNNSDRIQVGANDSQVANNWTSSLATLSRTTDAMSFAVLRAARDKAKESEFAEDGLRVSPVMADEEEGTENYVAFLTSKQINDLKKDPEYQANYRSNPAPTHTSNPLWKGGDIMVDGIIVREIASLRPLGKVGATANDLVSMGFLCGQNAVVVAYGKSLAPISESEDYDFRKGVGLMEIRGQTKVSFNGKQFGVVTILTASA